VIVIGAGSTGTVWPYLALAGAIALSNTDSQRS
jgi:hypothetical protein